MRRCAIYTRKSTEEGLEQEFNSLDAQHDACEAFIRSQKHEGWRAVRHRFDDGGYSGGTMERPALARLLAAIERREIDIVVVYKVDRLTRSLADFARMVDLFDRHGVSFVSVTQQFNTTTSMGRLTLNVLLSFAQFEREVTAERIRDKIAASKKKGMWMGGLPPLGYDARDRRLVVNDVEAETVRQLFLLYLKLGTVRALRDETLRLGIVTKQRLRPSATCVGKKPFSRGNLYTLLSNPIYVGKVRHKDQVYEGQHDAIVDSETWEQVQMRLKSNRAARRSPTNAKHPAMLAGLAFDETGDRLSPSHANKNGRRHRYYISRRLMHDADRHADGWRLRADELEGAVVAALLDKLDHPRICSEIAIGRNPIGEMSIVRERIGAIREGLAGGDRVRRSDLVRQIVQRIDLTPGAMRLTCDRAALMPSPETTSQPQGEPAFVFDVPVNLRRRGAEARLIIPGSSHARRLPDPALCRLVARARLWFDQLASGDAPSIRAIADREGVYETEVGRALQLAFLAPDIVEAILDGRQPVELTADKLLRTKALPDDWRAQRRLLGFDE